MWVKKLSKVKNPCDPTVSVLKVVLILFFSYFMNSRLLLRSLESTISPQNVCCRNWKVNWIVMFMLFPWQVFWYQVHYTVVVVPVKIGLRMFKSVNIPCILAIKTKWPIQHSACMKMICLRIWRSKQFKLFGFCFNIIKHYTSFYTHNNPTYLIMFQFLRIYNTENSAQTNAPK